MEELRRLKALEEAAHSRMMILRTERDRRRSVGAALAYEDARRVWRAALKKWTDAKMQADAEAFRKRMEGKA